MTIMAQSSLKKIKSTTTILLTGMVHKNVIPKSCSGFFLFFFEKMVQGNMLI